MLDHQIKNEEYDTEDLPGAHIDLLSSMKLIN